MWDRLVGGNNQNIFYSLMYIQDLLRTWDPRTNWAAEVNVPFWTKDQRGVGGAGFMVWNFKGKKAIHMEIGKQIFNKYMFGGSSLTMRLIGDFEQVSLAREPPYHT